MTKPTTQPPVAPAARRTACAPPLLRSGQGVTAGIPFGGKRGVLRKLEAMVTRLNELTNKKIGEEYFLEYQERSGPVSTGEVRRGYYLSHRVDGYCPPRDDRYAWERYVNGRYIGSNFKTAKAHLKKLIAAYKKKP